MRDDRRDGVDHGASAERYRALDAEQRAVRRSPPEKALQPADLIGAARRLGVDLAALEAVVEVESAGAGFLPDGRPTILFEGHVLWRELERRGADPSAFAAGAETILYPRWTRQHYVGGLAEYSRLAEAIGLARAATGTMAAALCSASWGMFQIMGFNYKACGFAAVETFVEAMKEHERRHLEAFCSFVRAEGILPALQEKQWEVVARRYNGSGQVDTYAARLEAAYVKRSTD